VAPALPTNTVTVPDGSRIILRDVDLWDASGGGGNIFQVFSAAGGVLFAVETDNTVNGRRFQWSGRQVYNPGESIEFQPLVGTWDVQASGYQLTLT
jgi:hypothetical protein